MVAGSSSRLPLEHPEFRYSVARNPYSKKLLEFNHQVFSDHGTETHRGSWRDLFPDSGDRVGGSLNESQRPLPVEIGCNAGHVLVEWASKNPQNAYVGIDWKFKIIHKAAEKASKRGLKNTLFFRSHAGRLPYMFGEGEIDHLYLFFPDPWPKRRQWSNRFITAEKLREIACLVKSGGIFHIKTDHRGYFNWMEKAVAQVSDLWEVVERSEHLHAGNSKAHLLSFPEVTLFERLFVKDGLPIHKLDLKKRS